MWTPIENGNTHSYTHAHLYNTVIYYYTTVIMTSSTKLDPSPCLNQILECNGVSFENIELAEAVVHLKSGKELDLLILKGSQVRIPQGLFLVKSQLK